MKIKIQSAPFDIANELDGFGNISGETGAIVTFSGIVRNSPKGDLTAMEIEHYPEMTQKALEKYAKTAIDRWSLQNILIIHRFGRLKLGEQIMMVATAAQHRQDAFDAAQYLMDYLKSRAPFWKKEHTKNGQNWVTAKDSDEDALNRWV